MHRHECAFIMQIKGLSRILICMPVEMPISQTPFLLFLNIYSSPSQHSHAYSHRKRGQDGSGWLRMAQTPLQTAYVMAHARSACQLLFRVCVHSQN